MNFTKLLTSCKEKRQRMSIQAFTAAEKGSRTKPRQSRSLRTPNEP